MKKYLKLLPFVLAAVVLTACGKDYDKDELAYRTYGINCLNEGKYEEAIEAFEDALSKASGVGSLEVDICMYKAKALFLSGDTDAAFATYDALIEYKGYAQAYLQRGNLNLFLGKEAEAKSDFDDAVDADSKNYEIYIAIYESYKSNGKEEEGKSYLKDASELSGERANDHYYKGQIAYYLGNVDEAIDLLDTALSQDKVEANFFLSQIYREQGDADKANSYLQEYMKSEEVDADALVEAGLKELNDGQYDAAILLLETAKSQNPETTKKRMLKALVVAYENKGDYASAKATLSSYLKDYSDDDAAEKEMDFLTTRVAE